MKTGIKISAVIISVFMAIALLCPVLAVGAADTLVITTSSAEGERGDEVDVVLTVESNPGFAAMLINIPKTSGIEVVEVKNGTVMRQITVGGNILWDSAYDSTATGTLLTVTFRITDSAKAGENVINVKIYECFNENSKAVSTSITPIIINVIDNDVNSDPPVIGGDTESSESTEGNQPVESETETDPMECESLEKSECPESEETESTEKEDNGDNATGGGCFSAVGGIAILAVILPAAVIFVTKKRK